MKIVRFGMQMQETLGLLDDQNKVRSLKGVFDLSNNENIKFSKLSETDSDIWLNSNSKHEGSALLTPFLNSINDISERLQNLSEILDNQ